MTNQSYRLFSFDPKMLPGKLNSLVAAFFCLALLSAPWFLAGNLPPVRTVGLGMMIVCLLAIVCFPSLLGTPTRLGIGMKLLLLIGIGYAGFQLLPIGGSTISQYAPATRARICELVFGIGAFFVASHIFRNQKLLPLLFGSIALNGVLITFFGLAQTISQTDKVYWFYELIHGGEPFGPFVNGNNAGGYLLMCFAAANFFLALRVFRSQHQLMSQNDGPQEKSKLHTAINVVGRSFAGLETQQLYVVAAVAAIAAGVFGTLSRGASVALVASLIVGWGFLFRRNLAFALIALAIVSSGVGVLLWTQQDKAVVTNLETLSDVENSSRNRIAHWRDAWNYTVEALPLGSGLGTYSIMYTPYQTTPFKRWYKHAENQYLETAAELGVPGLMVLLLVICLAIAACFSLLAKPDSMSRAVGLTGLICLIGQSLAAVFDFGLYQPANTLLMATIMGSVFSQHNWFWSAKNVTNNHVPRIRILVSWLMIILVTATTAWAVYEFSAVDARTASRRYYERFDPGRDRERLADYQELLEYALRVRPDDAEAHYQLALNHVLHYRIAAVDAMVEEVRQAAEMERAAADEPATASLESPTTETSNEGGANKDVVDMNQRQSQPEPETSFEKQRGLGLENELTPEDAWNGSTLLALHRLARISEKMGGEFLEELVDSDPVQSHLTEAWQQLQMADERCDKYWFTQLGLAQLSLVMGEGDKEQEHLDEALRRCPTNSKLLYVAGLIKLQSRFNDSAYEVWNECLNLTREFDEPIIQYCRYEVGIRDFFERVLPSDPYFRLRIARKYFGRPEDLLVKKLLLNHTKMVLDSHELPVAERSFVLGEIARHSHDYPISIVHYKKAIDLEKHRADWRIQFARSLISAGMYEQAITELRICELYPGDHHLVAERLMRQVKRLRLQRLKEFNGLSRENM